MPHLRLENCFSQEHILWAKEIGASEVVFNMDPKSFEFCPLHIISEIYRENTHLSFILKFPQMKSFLVNALVDQFHEQIGNHSALKSVEFDCLMNEEEFFKINHKISWHAQKNFNWKNLSSFQNLEQLVFDQTTLDVIIHSLEAKLFLNSISDFTNNGGSLVLSLDLNEKISMALENFFDFRLYSIKIVHQNLSRYREIPRESLNLILNGINK